MKSKAGFARLAAYAWAAAIFLFYLKLNWIPKCLEVWSRTHG